MGRGRKVAGLVCGVQAPNVTAVAQTELIGEATIRMTAEGNMERNLAVQRVVYVNLAGVHISAIVRHSRHILGHRHQVEEDE